MKSGMFPSNISIKQNDRAPKVQNAVSKLFSFEVIFDLFTHSCLGLVSDLKTSKEMRTRVRVGMVVQEQAAARGCAWAWLLVRGDGKACARGHGCAEEGCSVGVRVGMVVGAWGWEGVCAWAWLCRSKLQRGGAAWAWLLVLGDGGVYCCILL